MRTFITAIGLLTLAQWAFVGLLYGFIHAQDKNSPETMAKLHDMPVVGGYFPKVTIITQEEKDREYGDELRARRLEAQRLYQLPAAWSPEEFETLTASLNQKGEELDKRERELEQRRLEVESMVKEIANRELALADASKKIDERAANQIGKEREMQLRNDTLSNQIDKMESENLKRNAKILASMTPAAAKDLLMNAGENETREERNRRFEEAAKVMVFLKSDELAPIMETMEPTDAALLFERMASISLEK